MDPLGAALDEIISAQKAFIKAQVKDSEKQQIMSGHTAEYRDLRALISGGHVTKIAAVTYLEHQLPAHHDNDIRRLLVTQALEILKEYAAEKWNYRMYYLIETVQETGELGLPGFLYESAWDREIWGTLVRLSRYLESQKDDSDSDSDTDLSD